MVTPSHSKRTSSRQQNTDETYQVPMERLENEQTEKATPKEYVEEFQRLFVDSLPLEDRITINEYHSKILALIDKSMVVVPVVHSPSKPSPNPTLSSTPSKPAIKSPSTNTRPSSSSIPLSQQSYLTTPSKPAIKSPSTDTRPSSSSSSIPLSSYLTTPSKPAIKSPSTDTRPSSSSSSIPLSSYLTTPSKPAIKSPSTDTRPSSSSSSIPLSSYLTPRFLKIVMDALKLNPYYKEILKKLTSPDEETGLVPIQIEDDGAIFTYNEVLYRDGKLVIGDDDAMKLEIMSQWHDCNWDQGDQYNVTNTLNAISQVFYWDYADDVRNFVQNKCPCCADRLPIPEGRFASLYVDLLGGLRPSAGYDSVLVVVDRSSNFTVVIPFPMIRTFDNIKRLFTDNVVSFCGQPKSIVSHPDRLFVRSRRWMAFCDGQAIERHYSSKFTPPDYDTLESNIRKYCTRDGWHETIRMSALKLNSKIQKRTNSSAFEQVFDQPAPTFALDLKESKVGELGLFEYGCAYEAFGSDQAGGEEVDEVAEVDEVDKVDRGPFKVGDKVLVRTKHFAGQNFLRKWIGVFSIFRADRGSGMYWIELPGSMTKYAFISGTNLARFNVNLMPHERQLSTSKIDFYCNNPLGISNITDKVGETYICQTARGGHFLNRDELVAEGYGDLVTLFHEKTRKIRPELSSSSR